MDTLNALREAIEEELQFNQKLRGQLLNVIDSAIEKEGKEKSNPQAERVTGGIAEAINAREPQNVEEEAQEPDLENEEQQLNRPTWGTSTSYFDTSS